MLTSCAGFPLLGVQVRRYGWRVKKDQPPDFDVGQFLLVFSQPSERWSAFCLREKNFEEVDRVYVSRRWFAWLPGYCATCVYIHGSIECAMRAKAVMSFQGAFWHNALATAAKASQSARSRLEAAYTTWAANACLTALAFCGSVFKSILLEACAS